MENFKVPLIENISLANIGDYLCTQFGYKKGDLGSFIYQDSATFRKKANGSRPVQPDDTIHLENTITEKICGGNTAKYFELMKRWFPELCAYEYDSDIRTIISSNLMGLASSQHETSIAQPLIQQISVISFFQSCLNHIEPIHSIQMTFQTGWTWFDDIEKRELLKNLLGKKISIRVIANPMSSVTRDFIYAMRDSEKELDYKGVNETLGEWHKYEEAFPNLELIVSADYPILHELCITEFLDGTSMALIRDYAYGSPVEKLGQYKLIQKGNVEYDYFKQEFDFLWSKGLSYKKWKKTLPKKKELFPAGEYVLIYPSHEMDDRATQSWIYCSFSVMANNKVSMQANIGDLSHVSDSEKKYEYLYEGEMRVTGKIIYATLHDEAYEEVITISFPRPGRHFKRYIGIMCALNPSGNAPIAFKCACFNKTVLSHIDYERLRLLLSNNNQMYHESLMILEPQDTDFFYSNGIFK